MKKTTRRSFLKNAAAAGAAFPLFTIAGTKASGRVLGANDVIRIGVAGINGQGNSHIDEYLKLEKAKGVHITYLIDPEMVWPDGITASPDGYMYVSASQISAAAMFHGGKAENKAPYLIYRFKPLAAGYVSR